MGFPEEWSSGGFDKERILYENRDTAADAGCACGVCGADLEGIQAGRRFPGEILRSGEPFG